MWLDLKLMREICIFIAGDPEEPATLISTLLLQTHARLLYCLAQARFFIRVDFH